MAIALSLPRADAVTEALLAPVSEVSPEALSHLLSHAIGSLTQSASAVPTGQRLLLDSFRLAKAIRSPDSCAAPQAPFVPSTYTCRRSVAIEASSRVVKNGAAPGEAVAEVLAEAVAAEVTGQPRWAASEAPWWARWYAGLDPGGRAAMAAEAVTWTTQLTCALSWRRITGPLSIGGPDQWWNLPGPRTLALRGRADVRVVVDSRPVLVVVSGGVPGPDHKEILTFPALVTALASTGRSVPARVLGLWPASGLVRVVEIDEAALEQCVEAAARAVATWVKAMHQGGGG